jgi:hypothetical protein
MDNIFVERLWRSLKYEEVYLNAYATVAEAKAGIGCWLYFYNTERQHQSLGYRTPRQIYQECLWICGQTYCRMSISALTAVSPMCGGKPADQEPCPFRHHWGRCRCLVRLAERRASRRRRGIDIAYQTLS